MVTVWLRRYDHGGVPIALSRDRRGDVGAPPADLSRRRLLDDYLEPDGIQAGAWGSQAGGNLGNKPWTHGGCSG